MTIKNLLKLIAILLALLVLPEIIIFSVGLLIGVLFIDTFRGMFEDMFVG